MLFGTSLMTEVLHTDKPPFYRWYKNGKINTCYNALDRHVDEGNGERLALIYDSPITNSKETFTYSILRDRVALNLQERF